MSADFPSPSSSSLSSKIAVLANSQSLPYQANASPQPLHKMLSKMLPWFFFIGGMVIMAKLLHG